eukprot:2304870-Pyramimonas_sp.AAC.1
MTRTRDRRSGVTAGSRPPGTPKLWETLGPFDLAHVLATLAQIAQIAQPSHMAEGAEAPTSRLARAPHGS